MTYLWPDGELIAVEADSLPHPARLRLAGNAPTRCRPSPSAAGGRGLVAGACLARVLQAGHRHRPAGGYLPRLLSGDCICSAYMIEGPFHVWFRTSNCTATPTSACFDGASHPEELVARAAELRMEALALTDHDAVYGVPRFVRAAKARGIRPILAPS